MAEEVLAPGQVAELLSRQLGITVRPDRVRDWLREGRSPAGHLHPDQLVAGMRCLHASTARQLADDLAAIGWRPRPGRPRTTRRGTP